MSRITWGDVGERFYETGVDRGVLYVGMNPGVPWNGLSSIEESPDGGEAEPFYIDGFKHLNAVEAEEFVATINAYSAPIEFLSCDGSSQISNGLFATQQPRRPFGLCYRTRIGNDVEGLDHGYKLHLVYGAVASPTSRENATLSDDSEPMEMSWEITTSPPRMRGFKPTAHFVIDSTMTDPALLGFIEGYLYGSEGVIPRLLTQQQLVSLFNNWNTPSFGSPVNYKGIWNDISKESVVNMAINPDFKLLTSNHLGVSINYHVNPSAYGVNPAGFATWPGLQNSGTVEQGDPNGFELKGSIRNIWTTVGDIYSGDVGVSISNAIASMDTGDIFTLVFKRRVSRTGMRLATLSPYSASGANLLVIERSRATTLYPVEGSVYLEWITLQILEDTSTATDLRVLSSVSNKQDGDYVETGDVHIYPGAYNPNLTPHSGSYSPDPDLTTRWEGSPYNSTNISYGYQVNEVRNTGGITPIRSTIHVDSPDYSLRLFPTRDISTDSYTWLGMYGDSGFIRMGMIPGKTYTLKHMVYLEAPLKGSLNQGRLRSFITRNPGGVNTSVGSQATAPNIEGWHELKYTFQLESDVTQAYWRFIHGGLKQSGEVWLDSLILTEGNYSGPFFSGRTKNAIYKLQEGKCFWNGPEDKSTSTMEVYINLPPNPQLGDAWSIEGRMYIWNGEYWLRGLALPTI